MQSIYKALLFCILVLFGLACKSRQAGVKDSTVRLEIAEGGGFTGGVETYTLNSSGQIFKKVDWDTGFSELKPMSSANAAALITAATDLLDKTNGLNEPDNMFKSLTLFNGVVEKKAVWFHKQSELDEMYVKIIAAIHDAQK